MKYETMIKVCEPPHIMIPSNSMEFSGANYGFPRWRIKLSVGGAINLTLTICAG